VKFEYIWFLPLCSILWYQIEKQRLCKSINDRFLTDCYKTKSNYNVEKLKKIASKTTKTSNSQLTLRFNNLTFDCWHLIWRLQRLDIVRHIKIIELHNSTGPLIYILYTKYSVIKNDWVCWQWNNWKLLVFLSLNCHWQDFLTRDDIKNIFGYVSYVYAFKKINLLW
jgi:hypothetical protein